MDLVSGELTQLGKFAEPSTMMFAKFSPDGNKAGTIKSAVKVGVVSVAGGETRWFDIPGMSSEMRKAYRSLKNEIKQNRMFLTSQQPVPTRWTASGTNESRGLF
ncbi:MAG: hypothetical protein JXB26_05030 [Candidatus Aminicenantes bacterium]|nr:hypothetical protein [Candidatus Aminicenantes bacterium]